MEYLKSPFMVGLQITGYCTINCRYCYASNALPRNWSFEDSLKISKEILDLGVFSVSIEGGEPFLHPSWYEISRLFVDGGIEVTLLTNGTLYNDSIKTKLKRLSESSEFFNLQISLDSHVPNINDISRGKGKLVLKNINSILDAGLDVIIASVVHKYNIKTMFDLIEYYYPAVKRFHLMNLMATSKLEKGNHDLFPTRDQIASFWDSISEFCCKVPDISISTPLDDMELPLGQGSLKCEGCTAGLTRAAITPDLKVLPCGICDDLWIIGDLNKSTFERTWQSSTAERVRNLPVPPCKIVNKNKGPINEMSLSDRVR